MIVGAIQNDDSKQDVDLTKGMSLIGLSTAVSIDALAAGIGLAAVGANAWVAIPLIGAVSCLATWLAMRLAGKAGQRLGKTCEVGAGIVLIVLGIRFFVVG